MTTTTSLPPSQRKLWLAAIKPPMYTVAIIPIIVGTAVSFGDTQHFDHNIFFLFLFSAIFIIAWLNVSNDVFDAETGIDQNKAHSVVNLTGNKTLVFWLSNLFLAVGIGGIALITWLQQDFTVLLLIALSCALGYTYQGPPFRLGYQGLGEFICFITFGLLAIAAVYYSQNQTFSLSMLPASVFVGISTTIILFCSHFHQVVDDLAAGKRSPIVRLGTKRGSQVLAGLTVFLYILSLICVIFHWMPWQTLCVFLSLPLAQKLINHVNQYHDQPEKVQNCKFLAVNFHFVSGILLALGFILSSFPLMG